MKIEDLWLSLEAVVARLLRCSNNGYEGRISYYGEVGSLWLFMIFFIIDPAGGDLKSSIFNRQS